MRFYNDDIFTYIGPILVAANPYKMIPIFTPEFVTVGRLPSTHRDAVLPAGRTARPRAGDGGAPHARSC